jgi:hypothetical protein
MSIKTIKKNVKGSRTLKTNKKNVKGSRTLKTIKKNMIGSGKFQRFRRKVYTTLKMKPKNIQRAKALGKHIGSAAVFGILPYVGYRLYRASTDKDRSLEKSAASFQRYREKMLKSRTKGESYIQKLVIDTAIMEKYGKGTTVNGITTYKLNPVFNSNPKAKEEFLEAKSRHAFYKAEMEHAEYRATKYMKEIAKKGDPGLQQAIQAIETIKSNSTNPEYANYMRKGYISDMDVLEKYLKINEDVKSKQFTQAVADAILKSSQNKQYQ